MKHMRKFAAILLTLVLLTALPLSAAASGTQVNKTLSFLCYNVAGLPIPSVFSDTKRVVPEATKKIGKTLNECGCDIIAVQEDFQFHSTLAKQMTNYPYQTYTSGGVPMGDGLNIYSKYPFYNVERVAWEEAYGIFTQGADELAPKGFLKCTVDANGLLFDFYNIHVDAYGSEIDCKIKEKQFHQLLDYINVYSAGRAVVITGDYNVTLHTDKACDYYGIMIQGGGFSDAWCEVVNGGNYLKGADANSIISRYYAEYHNAYWGLWDSVERMLYRSGDLTVTPLTHKFEFFYDENGNALSDHASMRVDFKLTAQDYTRPALKLNPVEKENPLATLLRGIRYFLHSLNLINEDIWNWILYKQFR
ncbi:MAG TPA: hypothetical protein DDY98_02960 [Ruminococcaceae bacterium]|nr:hypothetical protein [Oscillospiraceae bacterium]